MRRPPSATRSRRYSPPAIRGAILRRAMRSASPASSAAGLAAAPRSGGLAARPRCCPGPATPEAHFQASCAAGGGASHPHCLARSRRLGGSRRNAGRSHGLADTASPPRWLTPAAHSRPARRAASAGARFSPLVVIAWQARAGGELNFSSDVDLVLLFPSTVKPTAPPRRRQRGFSRAWVRRWWAAGDARRPRALCCALICVCAFRRLGPLGGELRAFEDYLPRMGATGSGTRTSKPPGDVCGALCGN